MFTVYVLAGENGQHCQGCEPIEAEMQTLSTDFGIPYEIIPIKPSEFDAMKERLAYGCVERYIKWPKAECDRKCGNGILFGVPTIVYLDRVYVGTETPKALRQDLEDERAGRVFKPRTQWRIHGRTW